MTKPEDIERVMNGDTAPLDAEPHHANPRVDANVYRMAIRLTRIEDMFDALSSMEYQSSAGVVPCDSCVHRYVPDSNEPCIDCTTLAPKPSQWVAK